MTMLPKSPVPFRIDTLKTDSSRTTMGIFLSEIFISVSPKVIRHGQSIVTFYQKIKIYSNRHFNGSQCVKQNSLVAGFFCLSKFSIYWKRTTRCDNIEL